MVGRGGGVTVNLGIDILLAGPLEGGGGTSHFQNYWGPIILKNYICRSSEGLSSFKGIG